MGSHDFWEDEKRDLIDPVWAEYLKHSDDLARHGLGQTDSGAARAGSRPFDRG
ncbi:hypothetical protein [Micromonospora sp. CPCC 206061]|uniref:hypothetical protein n=1 Tax=Micromonospora sp. CPCC 206061 TaxID=3122410 RepID=UPI002FF3E205